MLDGWTNARDIAKLLTWTKAWGSPLHLPWSTCLHRVGELGLQKISGYGVWSFLVDSENGAGSEKIGAWCVGPPVHLRCCLQSLLHAVIFPISQTLWSSFLIWGNWCVLAIPGCVNTSFHLVLTLFFTFLFYLVVIFWWFCRLELCRDEHVRYLRKGYHGLGESFVSLDSR